MPERIVFTGKQQVELETIDPGEPGEGHLRVRTLVSLMSTGTENIVFNRSFGEGTAWADWVSYPFYPGYALAAEVEKVGPGVEGLAEGDRVVCRYPHASHQVVPAGEAYPIPDEVETEQAPWFALAKIASIGARAAEHRPGQSVLVVGAGPIGQMALRWAVAAGTDPVISVDMVEKRLEMARDGGATHTVRAGAHECEEEVRAANGGELPELVIDSTGNAKVFPAALGLVGYRGRLVLLGDTGYPREQHLTSDLIQNGITVAGAHDKHVTDDWNESIIARVFFSLVTRGRFRLAGLNTHTFAPADCAEGYKLANTARAETMGILFDWRQG